MPSTLWRRPPPAWPPARLRSPFPTSVAALSVSAPSNAVANGAKVLGSVDSTGGNNPTITVHWGDNDAGTGSWDSTHSLGVKGAGVLAHDVQQLWFRTYQHGPRRNLLLPLQGGQLGRYFVVRHADFPDLLLRQRSSPWFRLLGFRRHGHRGQAERLPSQYGRSRHRLRHLLG